MFAAYHLSAPVATLPVDVANQIQRAAGTAMVPAQSSGAFVAAEPLTPAQVFWQRHKTKIFIGGGLAAGGLIVYLLAR